jgi:DNA replication licensing factor MCM7
MTAPARKGEIGEHKYQLLLHEVATRATARFLIDLDDVQMFAPDLVKDIMQNAKRYTSIFCAAIDELLPPISRSIGTEGDTVDDVLRSTRVANLDKNPDVSGDGEQLTDENVRKYLPPALLRRYEVRFAPLTSQKAVPLRNITAQDIGRLVSVRCIVLRSSDVKPLIEVASYAWCVAFA